MNFSAFRFFLFACVAALCLTLGCRDDSSQAQNERINIFSRRNSSSPKKDTPRATDDSARRITEALRSATDHEKKGTFKATVVFGCILAGVGGVVGGLLYWQFRMRKRVEWELNDPMALVKELTFVHQLSEQEKNLMQNLADRNALSSPLNLFVEPKFLLEAWEDIAPDLERPLVRRLLSKLFEITVEDADSDLGNNLSAVTMPVA